MFPWAVESPVESPLQFFGVSVANLNEPLATSTINQSIIYLYQTSGPYQKIEIIKRRNKSNKSNSTQYSLETV